MIRGVVNPGLEAVVRVRGPGGARADVEAILDTGFPSALTLPPAVVTALGLARLSGGSAALADGSVRPLDLYAAEVDWGGTWRPVLVSAGRPVPHRPPAGNACRTGMIHR